jgi:multiple antibiotic resistance protein
MDFVLPILQTMFLAPLALLPVINPLTSAPVFIATAGRSQEVTGRLARQVAINSWCVLVASMVVGTQVLAFFGLSLPVVRIAGGLLVAANGWRMLHSTDQDEVQAVVAEETVELSEPEIIRRSFFPITFPLTTGPGAIAAAIALGTQVPRGPLQILITLATAMVGAALTAYVLYLTFKHAAALLDKLGEIGGLVMVRVVAFLLLCIGIQFIFTGWEEFYVGSGG